MSRKKVPKAMKIADHEPKDIMPDEGDMDRIMDFVAALGLHGILLIAKPCANCGQLHDFAIASDLQDYEDVPHVLARYAAATAVNVPVQKGKPKRTN